MSDKGITLIIQGTPISPGLAEGIIHVHRNLLGPIDVPVDIEQKNVEEEFCRLDVATRRISEDLLALAMRVEKEIDLRLAKVFEAHQLILDDSSLKEELRKEIADNVERYFNDAADVIFRLLRMTHDDVPDVPLSVCGELAGRPEHIPRLLQCGIRTFSIAPPLVPVIKEAIRNSLCSEPLTRTQ